MCNETNVPHSCIESGHSVCVLVGTWGLGEVFQAERIGPGRLCQHNLSMIGSLFGENYAGIIGTFSYLNGNNRLVCKVSFSTCTLFYTVQYSREYPCGPIVAIYLWACNGMIFNQFQFHYCVAYTAPVECKNSGIIGNLKRIVGSFCGIKE